MHQAAVFAAIGVAATLLGFVIYNMRHGPINTASWLLWVIGDVLEAGSYFVMTGEDVLKNAVPFAFACGSCITFVIALSLRRFGMPDAKDQAVVGVDLAITAGWWQHYLSATAANIMFVATEVISFIPLYRGVLTGREREHAAPWLLWAAGDAFFLATILSLPYAIEETVYPVSAMAAHFIVVACIAARKAKEAPAA